MAQVAHTTVATSVGASFANGVTTIAGGDTVSVASWGMQQHNAPSRHKNNTIQSIKTRKKKKS